MSKTFTPFWGFPSYYWKFVNNFSKLAGPLHDLVNHCINYGNVKSPQNFKKVWDKKCQSAVEALKIYLVETPLLEFTDYIKPFILEVDASKQGLDAMLPQEEAGSHRVIAYPSRCLHGSETNMPNYSSVRLDMSPLKWAITEKFRNYLPGSKFIVYTDNNLLMYFHKMKLRALHQPWAMELAIFDFTVKYRSGWTNVNAERPLRRPHEDSGDSDSEGDFGIPLCSVHNITVSC